MSKKFVVAQRPQGGLAKQNDFSLVEETLPNLCDGGKYRISR